MANSQKLGFGGNDTLDGDTAPDLVTGQGGTDRLTDGVGADVFTFDDQSEIGTGDAGDAIVDFVHGQEIIHLTGDDADPNPTGDQQFIFLGNAAFAKMPGHLRDAFGVLSGEVRRHGKVYFKIEQRGAPYLALRILTFGQPTPHRSSAMLNSSESAI